MKQKHDCYQVLNYQQSIKLASQIKYQVDIPGINFY